GTGCGRRRSVAREDEDRARVFPSLRPALRGERQRHDERAAAYPEALTRVASRAPESGDGRVGGNRGLRCASHVGKGIAARGRLVIGSKDMLQIASFAARRGSAATRATCCEVPGEGREDA